MKLTPWFPPEVKPVRVGVYIATVRKPSVFYRYWDGESWLCGSFDQQLANASRPDWYGPPIHWRGLAKQPKEQA